MIVIVMIIIVGLTLNLQVQAADVGNSFSSGGFSSSYSGSSSSGDLSGSIFDIIYIILYLPFPLNIMVIGLMIYFVVVAQQKTNYNVKKNQIKRNVKSNQHVNMHKQEIIKDLIEIRENDPSFSKFEFESYAKELYLMIEEAIESQDTSKISNYVNPELLKNFEQYINQIKSQGKHNIFDGQEFLSSEIKDIVFDPEYQKIVLELFINEKTLIINDNKKVPNNINRINKVVELEFVRKSNMKTNDARLSVTNCQTCGAPNSIEASGSCQYCGTNLVNDYSGWVLMNERKLGEKESLYYKMYSSGVLSIHNHEQKTVEQVLQVDKLFNQEEFEQYVAESFIAVQEGWENRDMESVRKFESDELFRTHRQQIQEYIDKKQYPYLENQEINDIHLNEFIIDGKNEYLNVIVDCNLQVFLKDASGKIIDGNESFKNNGYKLRYKRAVGVESQKIELATCPNCGAPLEFGESGACAYCQSFVTNGEHGWVLDNYEALYQFKNGNINYRKSVYEKMKLKQEEQKNT